MKRTLINLQTKDYEHPIDRQTLQALKKLPGVESAVNFIMNWAFVKRQIISMCGSNYHVTSSACPLLSQSANDVFKILDLSHKPELYVYQDFYINAYTTGHEQDAFIVLSSGGVDRLSEAELEFVIGHEAGHIKSGHVLYHLLSANLAALIPNIPLLSWGIKGALYKWNRVSEFTADRAGLLACQNLDVALSAIMKISGLPEKYYGTAFIEGFKQQAREFQDKYSGTADQLMKFLEIFDEDHPWTVLRAAELVRWYESGEYEEVINAQPTKQCSVCKQAVDVSEKECPVCGYKFES